MIPFTVFQVPDAAGLGVVAAVVAAVDVFICTAAIAESGLVRSVQDKSRLAIAVLKCFFFIEIPP